MASLFEHERDALSVPAIQLHASRRGENETVDVDDDADGARARRARRRAMARCVLEGETSLLEEIARDFRRLADEA
jgi:chemotaxis protein histidine kinase CheA